jgi:hypothetical protein
MAFAMGAIDQFLKKQYLLSHFILALSVAQAHDACTLSCGVMNGTENLLAAWLQGLSPH